MFFPSVLYFFCPNARQNRRAAHICGTAAYASFRRGGMPLPGMGKIIPSRQEAEHELVIVHRRHRHEDIG